MPNVIKQQNSDGTPVVWAGANNDTATSDSTPFHQAVQASTGATATSFAPFGSGDFDSGAGTDTRACVGLLLPGSGGAVIGGTSSNPLRFDPTGTTTQPISDAGGSLTVDAPLGTPVSVRLSDGTSAIATLPVSLASLPVLNTRHEAAATPLSVRLSDGSAFGSVLTTGGTTRFVEVSFTRPADTTAYAANDIVSNSTSSTTPIDFSSAARIAAGSGLALTFQLIKSTNTTTGATFRLWLYTATPTSPPNDNAAFSATWGNRTSRIGYVDFLNPIAGSDCVDYYGSPVFTQQPFKLASGTSLYGLLQVLGAYTPGNAEIFYFRVGVVQD